MSRAEDIIAYVEARNARKLAEGESVSARYTAERCKLEDAYGRALGRRDLPHAADCLVQLSRRAALECDESAAIRYAADIFDLPSSSGATAFKGYLALANYFLSIGYDAEVLATLAKSELAFTGASLGELCDYLEYRAIAQSRLGYEEESKVNFGVFLELCLRHQPPEEQATGFATAAINTSPFGINPRIHALHERAIELGRGSPNAALTLTGYAWTLLLCGDLRKSRSVLERAEVWTSKNLQARLLRSAVGISLSHLLPDRALAKKCLDLDALVILSSTSTAYRAGPLTGAMIAYHAEAGDLDAARRLLSNTLQTAQSAQNCWLLLLAAAQYGSALDCEHVLAMLSRYKQDFRLMEAFRLLLKGRIAMLGGALHTARELSAQAAHLFGFLQWRYHQAVSLELAEHKAEARRLYRDLGALRRYHAIPRSSLTHRSYQRRAELSSLDYEIAMLVTQGKTNKQIAGRLALAERTVKYHLSAIFDVLGVHRRSELAEALQSQGLPDTPMS